MKLTRRNNAPRRALESDHGFLNTMKVEKESICQVGMESLENRSTDIEDLAMEPKWPMHQKHLGARWTQGASNQGVGRSYAYIGTSRKVNPLGSHAALTSRAS